MVLLALLVLCVNGQDWSYSCIGSCDQDKVTTTNGGGTVLNGGGGLVDKAFLWMIDHCNGGDFFTISQGTNVGPDIWELAKGQLNSVSTLLIPGYTVPFDDEFLRHKIDTAEALWYGGGDQHLYYLWKGTPIGRSLVSLPFRNVTVGGTSAGMAIQAGVPYVPSGDGATSAAALQNPYYKAMEFGADFLDNPFLLSLVTDTHFVERDRMGRSLAFMARLLVDYGGKINTVSDIACDEATSVLVSDEGKGFVFSQLELNNSLVDGGHAYFFIPQEDPKECSPGQPLTFENIDVWRLSDGDVFDFHQMKGEGPSVHQYIISVDKGVVYTKGNNGNIY